MSEKERTTVVYRAYTYDINMKQTGSEIVDTTIGRRVWELVSGMRLLSELALDIECLSWRLIYVYACVSREQMWFVRMCTR